MDDAMHGEGTAAARVELYWIPLGAGGSPLVRLSGRIFEWISARRERRRPRQLHHAALVIERDGIRWAIEMAPAWQLVADDRGVVASGPVGAPLLGRSRWFRYEVRRWPGGRIPDLDHAHGEPAVIATDRVRAGALLRALEEVPALTWGRDELGFGEMWNSNSLVSWALERSGHAASSLTPPDDGRAPGWHAGLALAARRGAVPS
jgi:hypothetical protein